MASGASVNIATMAVVAAPIIVSAVALVKGIRFRGQNKKTKEEIMVQKNLRICMRRVN